jgi:hypothetical protein
MERGFSDEEDDETRQRADDRCGEQLEAGRSAKELALRTRRDGPDAVQLDVDMPY